MPTVHQALGRLDYELAAARREGHRILKLIHGYGSSGAGGDIRIAVQRRLMEKSHDGEIRACIFGEDWSISDERTWKLLKTRPELKEDRDLGRKNLGITIVVL
ncbi:MAG TPA: Smr/MutS family protein [Terriglobales bacterium]|nr:Smr/MutS family protein [Terriglobales bacterium]